MIHSTDEHRIGITSFYTTTPPLQGVLRYQPEDFLVTEQLTEIPPSSQGPYTLAQITAKNWETNHLINELSHRLHISRQRIGFAGTKDKRAVTTQWMSFFRVPPQHLQDVSLKDVTITKVFPTAIPLSIGDLQQNHFDVTIRKIPDKDSKKVIKSTIQQLSTVNGFPNFFGVQRFGSIRPITHLVGKHMVHGEFKQAVMTYLCALDDNENKDITEIRTNLASTYDYQTAVSQFPKPYTYEKSLCHWLVSHPDDYIGALQQLPKNLLTMFIYAYQSFLFNIILSERLRQHLPLHQAVEGDVVVPLTSKGFTEEYFQVTQRNLQKVNEQLRNHKAAVTTILLGSETRFSLGAMGEIEHAVVENEHLDHRLFIIPEIPSLSSKGTRRAILTPIYKLKYKLNPDMYHPRYQALTVSFDLLKGCYATSLLRELMKAPSITAY